MQSVLSLLLLAGAATAHSIAGELTIGGTTYPWGHAIRVPSYNGPITDPRSNSIACNGPPNDNPIANPNVVLNVGAGSSVTVRWQHSQGSVIDSSHKGPVMAYMKKVSSATSDSGVGGGWFKIFEDGYNGATWGVDRLISAGGRQTVTIPSCIAPGNYLLRFELIALHSAGSAGGAQFYMECAQINVTGGGSTSPATISLPGAYSTSDPGVTINIYPPPPTYVIPGPRPFSCNGQQPPQTSQPPQTFTTSTRTTSQPPTTTSSTGGQQVRYGQCGGNGWTGPTTCVSGSTCTCQNEWYCQCT